MRLLLALCAALVLSLPLGVSAQQVVLSLAWDRPEYEDGTTATDLAGYRLCVSTSTIVDSGQTACGPGTESYLIDDPDTTEFTLVWNVPGGEPVGRVYLRLRAHNIKGEESPFSNEISRPFAATGPPPSGAVPLLAPSLRWK